MKSIGMAGILFSLFSPTVCCSNVNMMCGNWKVLRVCDCFLEYSMNYTYTKKMSSHIKNGSLPAIVPRVGAHLQAELDKLSSTKEVPALVGRPTKKTSAPSAFPYGELFCNTDKAMEKHDKSNLFV